MIDRLNNLIEKYVFGNVIFDRVCGTVGDNKYLVDEIRDLKLETDAFSFYVVQDVMKNRKEYYVIVIFIYGTNETMVLEVRKL